MSVGSSATANLTAAITIPMRGNETTHWRRSRTRTATDYDPHEG